MRCSGDSAACSGCGIEEHRIAAGLRALAIADVPVGQEASRTDAERGARDRTLLARIEFAEKELLYAVALRVIEKAAAVPGNRRVRDSGRPVGQPVRRTGHFPRIGIERQRPDVEALAAGGEDHAPVPRYRKIAGGFGAARDLERGAGGAALRVEGHAPDISHPAGTQNKE